MMSPHPPEFLRRSYCVEMQIADDGKRYRSPALKTIVWTISTGRSRGIRQ
jgi:hypothetical protein